MGKFLIRGGKALRGEFPVSGMKNAATPILAAALLSKRPVTIRRVPQIVDVDRMLELVERVGGKVKKSGSTVVIDARNVSAGNPDPLLMKRMRSSILLISPLLVLHDTVTFPTPGGCHIGNRPIDTHIDALRQLGVKTIEKEDGSFQMNKDGKPLSTVILSEFSVTATENALIYASSLTETVKIKMAAAEPHVQDLCGFLVRGGVSITGIGTHELIVTGTKEFAVDEWEVIPDQIEIGTIAIAAAVTNGDVDIHPVVPDHLDAILMKMKEAGVSYSITGDHLRVASTGPYKHFSLQALPHPGFPTDLQAPMAVLATQAQGLSLIHDPLYNARFSYIQELASMGAQAVVCDPHRVLISGVTPLRGEKIKSFDLRAGATLILAGLIAKGETVIEDAEVVDRGYEAIDKRLRALGADIERIQE